MALSTASRMRVEDRSGVAPARREAERMADALGFDERRRGEVAIVVTELATNLVRHGGGGEIILTIGRGSTPTVDAIAYDRGPGIAEPARAREDGYSTLDGPGNGLGAVQRLSATMDLHTQPRKGTAVAVRLGAARTVPHVDGIALALAGETSSGDAWGHVGAGEHRSTILLSDGLGHGDDAALASAAAVRELRSDLTPAMLLERVHRALRSTRGAAAAVAQLDRRTGMLEFAGIGNIAAAIVDGTDSKSLVSMPGILGHGVQRMRTFTYELPPGSLLVMHSDGCRSGWDLSAYPGAQRRDPLVVASLLIRDFERGNDDVSVVVARAAP
jgi:anti-sigma regulatory factor (Ser/Thr protein kinase)